MTATTDTKPASTGPKLEPEYCALAAPEELADEALDPPAKAVLDDAPPEDLAGPEPDALAFEPEADAVADADEPEALPDWPAAVTPAEAAA